MQFDLSSGYRCSCSAGRGTVHCAILTGRKSLSWKSSARAFCMESVWSVISPSSLSGSIKIAALMTLLSFNAVWPCCCLCPQCLEVSPDNQTLANRSCCFELQKVWGRTGLEISKQQLLGEGECLVSQRVPSAVCDTEKLVIYGFHLLSDALSCGESEQPCSPLGFDLSSLSLWQNLHPIIQQ